MLANPYRRTLFQASEMVRIMPTVRESFLLFARWQEHYWIKMSRPRELSYEVGLFG